MFFFVFYSTSLLNIIKEIIYLMDIDCIGAWISFCAQILVFQFDIQKYKD